MTWKYSTDRWRRNFRLRRRQLKLFTRQSTGRFLYKVGRNRRGVDLIDCKLNIVCWVFILFYNLHAYFFMQEVFFCYRSDQSNNYTLQTVTWRMIVKNQCNWKRYEGTPFGTSKTGERLIEEKSKREGSSTQCCLEHQVKSCYHISNFVLQAVRKLPWTKIPLCVVKKLKGCVFFLRSSWTRRSPDILNAKCGFVLNIFNSTFWICV